VQLTLPVPTRCATYEFSPTHAMLGAGKEKNAVRELPLLSFRDHHSPLTHPRLVVGSGWLRCGLRAVSTRADLPAGRPSLLGSHVRSRRRCMPCLAHGDRGGTCRRSLRARPRVLRGNRSARERPQGQGGRSREKGNRVPWPMGETRGWTTGHTGAWRPVVSVATMRVCERWI